MAERSPRTPPTPSAPPRGLKTKVGRELAPLSENEMRVHDARIADRAFCPAAVHADLHGAHEACPVLPKKPTGGWKESDAGKWWAREL